MSDNKHINNAANEPVSGLPTQVWQPWAMGGGEWRTPTVVTLSDHDVNRIARAVVRLLRETTNDTPQTRDADHFSQTVDLLKKNP